MFYYGQDFHDLAPNFVLNILAFIVVCEAFLRICPHFGLWLKTFDVKPKVVSGTQAECGGAMAGRMDNALWFDGSRQGGFTSPSHATRSGSRPSSSDQDPP